MALMYSYLIAKRKIDLPTSSDSLMSEDSEVIEQVLHEMCELLKKEKMFIRDVFNTGIEFIREKEEAMRNQQEEKKLLEAEQAKKIAKAKMINKL